MCAPAATDHNSREAPVIKFELLLRSNIELGENEGCKNLSMQRSPRPE
jgi:hypothetical protein